MEVIHRLALNVDPQRQVELARLGVRVELGFSGFDVAESDADWSRWQDFIRRHRPSDVVWTTFTNEEIRAPAFVSMRAKDQVGYPQPHEDQFGYLEATYDLTDYCEDCGIGARQNAPFQFKREPRWGHRWLLQLNWVFDEFFIRVGPDADAFREHGIATRPVVDRSLRELATVAQLDVHDEAHLDTRGLQGQICASCHRLKYLPVVRGALPPLVAVPGVATVKTAEWFGSGHSAYREVLISQSLRESLSRQVARGVSFIPTVTATA